MNPSINFEGFLLYEQEHIFEKFKAYPYLNKKKSKVR